MVTAMGPNVALSKIFDAIAGSVRGGLNDSKCHNFPRKMGLFRVGFDGADRVATCVWKEGRVGSVYGR